ncbi:DUF1361 domain-containing protein [Schleiferilactobacillus shenzhenensis]|uniref:DUF1361 domain-containing protein n=1 Tax=Schleiferilactobacillus shenzhenensis TaxID=1231337 RepID=UPI0004250471|nr:DUF1361 domain-containing protein [Schleiferilactobacillus shenzhenensis]
MTIRRWHWAIRLFFWLYIILTAWQIQGVFSFLAFNTLLAYIPIELGFILQADRFHWRWAYWLTALVWLLFYPNAPYILTDFFHLSLLEPYGAAGLLRNSLPMWGHFLLLVGVGLIAAWIAQLGSEKILQQMLARHPRWLPWARLAFYTVVGIGIYIGRFLRLHTFYLLTPALIWRPLMRMWSWHMLGFVALMVILQYVIWLLIQYSRAETDADR